MKNQRGITLLSLLIVVVMIFILTSTTIYSSLDRMKINKLNKMYNDIELLEDRISSYYLKYGNIPILQSNGNNVAYTYTTISFNTNINDDENYYIIDLQAIGKITLNYGEQGYINPNKSDDVYIINEKTHTVYYVKGIESKGGNIYHSKAIEEEETVDNIPPSIPEINVITGTKDETVENTDNTISYYNSDVKIEFVSGKDNWSGIDKTTYSINGSEEVDINSLTNNVYTITESGTYEIRVISYDNNSNSSESKIIIVINK